jgi:hypothetical protein
MLHRMNERSGNKQQAPSGYSNQVSVRMTADLQAMETNEEGGDVESGRREYVY